MSKLEGKVALVTGGNSGIGFATAQRFVEEGAHVYITGRRQEHLDKAGKALGKNVTAIRGDVSNPYDLDRLYERVKNEKGHLDIVVANAGYVEIVPLTELSDHHYDKIFDINVRGVIYTVQKALPLIQDGGSIILVGSIAAFKSMPGYSVYAASKAAVRAFARNWAFELKERRIRVNNLSPGPIDTPIIDIQVSTPEQATAMRSGFAAAIPLGRMGHAEELAAAAVFLASNESSFVTGSDLCVDGGLGQM